MKEILIIAGTLLPIAGPAMTIAIGLCLQGWPRWAMLFLGPVVSILPSYYYGTEIGTNGNMLFVALMGVAFVFLVLYYPLLVMILLVGRFRRRRGRRQVTDVT